MLNWLRYQGNQLQVRNVTFILFNNHGYKLERGELIYHDMIKKGFVDLAYQGKDIVSKFII